MNYTLYSNGRLLPGGDAKQALAAAVEIFKIPEKQAQKAFLSGRRKRITTSADKERLERLAAHFRISGLDVEVAPADKQEPARDRKRYLPRWLATVALLLILVGGGGGFGWYWLYVAVPAPVLQAEAALADGNLVAIGYVDVRKAVTLADIVLGGFDPNALPQSGVNRELFNGLFFGAPQFERNLQLAMVSVHFTPDPKEANVSLLLAGSFTADPIIAEFGRAFEIAPAGAQQWTLSKQPDAQSSSARCPKVELPVDAKKSAPLHLRIGPHWLMIATNQEMANDLWRRLESGSGPAQDLARWQSYRAAQLAAFLAQKPGPAAHAVGGFPGLIAAKAAEQSPELQAAAASIAVDIPAGGLELRATLFSEDAQWNRSTTDKVRQSLDKFRNDTGALSPTLARLTSRVAARNGDDRVTMTVTLDKGVLGEMEQVVGDVIAAMFTPNLTNAKTVQVVQDEIQQHVADYSMYANLAALPNRPHDDNERPLFADGGFAVDLGSIISRDGASLEMRVDGRVQLPPGRQFGAPAVEEISLFVDSVESADGVNLLRDELCSLTKNVFGSKNHEPQISFSTSNQQAWLAKTVRLNPGVKFEDIARITGVIKFAAPTAVRKVSLGLQAGEVVEHEGMRFYLSGVRGSSVTYQVSGDSRRLLEVRALNEAGQALHGDWSMGSEGEGRVTRSFKGEVHGLELYIAEQWLEQEKRFVLHDLQAMPPKPPRNTPEYFAPAQVDPRAWQKYVKQNFDALNADPKDWFGFGGLPQVLAERKWSGLKAYFTYKPAQWGNDPQAHLYFPALPELPGVLSALSYRIEMPAPEKDPVEMFVRASYPYYTNTGALAIKHELNGLPVAQQSFGLRSGLGPNQEITQLKGEFTVRLPMATASAKLPLNELWQGKTVNGVTLTLTEISRGMFPGYALKVEGELNRLVNVHGLAGDGDRVAADPVNFQSDGYWTLTLPFGVESVELVIATEQEIMTFPFDIARDGQVNYRLSVPAAQPSSAGACTTCSSNHRRIAANSPLKSARPWDATWAR